MHDSYLHEIIPGLLDFLKCRISAHSESSEWVSHTRLSEWHHTIATYTLQSISLQSSSSIKARSLRGSTHGHTRPLLPWTAHHHHHLHLHLHHLRLCPRLSLLSSQHTRIPSSCNRRGAAPPHCVHRGHWCSVRVCFVFGISALPHPHPHPSLSLSLSRCIYLETAPPDDTLGG